MLEKDSNKSNRSPDLVRSRASMGFSESTRSPIGKRTSAPSTQRPQPPLRSSLGVRDSMLFRVRSPSENMSLSPLLDPHKPSLCKGEFK